MLSTFLYLLLDRFPVVHLLHVQAKPQVHAGTLVVASLIRCEAMSLSASWLSSDQRGECAEGSRYRSGGDRGLQVHKSRDGGLVHIAPRVVQAVHRLLPVRRVLQDE